MSVDASVRVPSVPSGPKIDNSQITRGGSTFYRQRVEVYSPYDIASDAGGRARVSQLSTLFDGKLLSADEPNLWNEVVSDTNAGSVYNAGIMEMDAEVGSYVIRQSKHRTPYFSGKSHSVEITFDTFAPQDGVTKRVGYFSSSTVAPYTDNFDGWYLESSGGSVKLVIVNDGTEKLSIDWASWDGYSDISTYNWDNFTVIYVDFLWLGGAVFRLFLKNPDGGFTLCHTFNYAGTSPGVFMRNPSQPVRYELRGDTGAGSFNAICSQVATEGAVSENYQSISIYNSALVSSSSVGTVYALKGVKKKYAGSPLRVESFGAGIASTDSGTVLLLLNPTLSGALTYADNGHVQEATATNQTITNVGTIIDSFQIRAAGESKALTRNALAWLGTLIDGTEDEIVLAYSPLTTNQSSAGSINLVRY